jgi:hypothetical protein
MMTTETSTPHLTDPELFNLALPPAGEPEALPRHLSECLLCSRALQEWKGAVRELAETEVEPLERRSAAEWEALENATIERLRKAAPTRRRSALRWAAGIAAAALLSALLVPSLRHRSAAPGPLAGAAAVSAQDAKDDALLRDVARLSREDDPGSWSSLAPDPSMPTEEEQL